MASLMEYKCPNCGGKIEFNVASGNLKCPFCGTEYKLEDLKAYEEVISEQTEDSINWDTNGQTTFDYDNLKVYVCTSCGGEIIADDTVAATSCPFCNSPIIIKDNLVNDLKPDIVVPFKFDKKSAKEVFYKHLENKMLLPKVFKDENHIDEIKGVYVPFWLYEADADAKFRYRATRIRTWSDSNYDYTDTSYYALIREGHIGYDKVPVDGSSKIDDELMQSIEPFDITQAIDFDSAVLSGFMANRYDQDADSLANIANERIKQTTVNAFNATVMGYNSVICEHSSIRLNNGKVIYALLPVWILSTSWKDENYIFAMNGQTGKFVGNLPCDNGVYFKHLLLRFVIIFVILLVLSLVIYKVWG